jgi:hypothetical protein
VDSIPKEGLSISTMRLVLYWDIPREQLSHLTIEEAVKDFLNSDWSRYWKLIQRRGFGRLITQHPYYEDHRSLDITVNFLECMEIRII